MINSTLLCKSLYGKFILFFLLLLSGFTQVQAQNATSSNIFGQVVDAKGVPVPGAVVAAKHEPSGSVYGVETREDGRFNLPNVRIGGPYTITVTQVGSKPVSTSDIFLSLGQNFRYDAQMIEDATTLNQVEVTAIKNEILSGNRTGAGTNIKRDVLNGVPTLGRSFNDFIRLTPQSNGSNSFAGQDNRFNNLTIDGSIFNNSFGLSSSNGGQTGSQPISLDAIDEVQVSVAPYDVRQGGFSGASINAVTRSGTNNFEGSVFGNYRNDALAGTKADTFTITKTGYDVRQFGARLGGPIIKDKLFFFANYEGERRTEPITGTGTSFVASRPGTNNLTDVNVSRASADSLDQLRDYLIKNYNYNPGAYENIKKITKSDKALVKFDWNILQTNQMSHRASLRFNYLTSSTDVSASGSGNNGSGYGGRSTSKNSLNFEASNYVINNDLYSGIFELNSVFGSSLANTLQFGYTANRDYRSSRGGVFPLVDILQGGSNVTSFGYEPFTPNNILNTDTYQFKDDITLYKGFQTITAGINIEAFKFDNTFTPIYYGQYVFNSIADFYKSSDAYLNKTTANVVMPQYQLTYSALPGNALPTATTKVIQPGIYWQDALSLMKDRLNITFGMRVDVPSFLQTALNNPEVQSFNFIDGNGNAVKTSTGKLPDPQVMLSPRFGFNYDIKGDRSLQVRGGVGIFTGRPPFVWLSNQVGNNGVLTGSIVANNTTKYPFSPDPTTYIPANATTPSSYNIAVTDANFQFPQVFRANLAIDKNLFWGIIGTLEGIYSSNLNAINYLNVNQVLSKGNYSGDDNRPYFPTLLSKATNDNRLYSKITNAILLTNTNQGYSASITAKLERQFQNNLYLMAAYTRSETKDLLTGGSIAATSWNSILSVKGNNLPDLAFSDNDVPNRFIASAVYKIPWFLGETQFSTFIQMQNGSRFSYVVSGDINGDGQSRNDLMWIPNKAEELTFLDIKDKTGAVTFSKQTQIDAFNQFLNNDSYLNTHRGQYAERNGALLGLNTTLDVALQHTFKFFNHNNLQLRVDVQDFGNVVSSGWGVSPNILTSTPLTFAGRDATTNKPTYTTTIVNGGPLTNNNTQSFGLGSVFQMQIGARYTFK